MERREGRASLTPAELASLDLTITLAQQRGIGMDAAVRNTVEQGEAMAEMHEAMWENRHGGGVELSEHDREVLGRIRELAGTLETQVSLGQLIELRAAAVRQRSE